jgi:hypothetical protein
VHLPYVETVPAVPTGCFVARSKLRYLTLPTADSLTSVRFAAMRRNHSPRCSGGVVFAARSSNAHRWAGG